LNLWCKGIDSIHEGFSKSCISKEIIETDSFDLVSVFEKLIESYPDAFVIVGFIQNRVYGWNLPERLLKAENKSFLLWQGHKSDGLDEVIWQKKNGGTTVRH
jgi:isochorismate synthase